MVWVGPNVKSNLRSVSVMLRIQNNEQFLFFYYVFNTRYSGKTAEIQTYYISFFKNGNKVPLIRKS